MSDERDETTNEAMNEAMNKASDTSPDATRRRIDVVGLVAGLVFVGMALAFALADLDQLEDQVRYVWPTAMLGIGLGMLLGTRNHTRRRQGS